MAATKPKVDPRVAKAADSYVPSSSHCGNCLNFKRAVRFNFNTGAESQPAWCLLGDMPVRWNGVCSEWTTRDVAPAK